MQLSFAEEMMQSTAHCAELEIHSLKPGTNDWRIKVS